MILVDINAPALQKSYDFWLDENSLIGDLIVEICEMISQKEEIKLIGNREGFVLCFERNHKILNNNETLSLSGVTNGDSLLIV